MTCLQTLWSEHSLMATVFSNKVSPHLSPDLFLLDNTYVYLAITLSMSFFISGRLAASVSLKWSWDPESWIIWPSILCLRAPRAPQVWSEPWLTLCWGRVQFNLCKIRRGHVTQRKGSEEMVWSSVTPSGQYGAERTIAGLGSRCAPAPTPFLSHVY